METNDELTHATGKLLKKKFDLVVLNSMNDNKATFGFDTNKITIINSDFTKKEFSLKPKNEVAKDIVEELYKLWVKRKVYAEIKVLN